MQGRRNGFEHGGDSETLVTFEPFVVQTSNLQFWKWQAKSQNMMEPWLHGSICSGGPDNNHPKGPSLYYPNTILQKEQSWNISLNYSALQNDDYK